MLRVLRVFRTTRLHTLLAITLVCATAATVAQTYPARPVRVIVPVPAGSGMDVVGRILSDKLGQNIGTPFVIENIGGANGSVGAAATARAAADGHTLLIWSDQSLLRDARAGGA